MLWVIAGLYLLGAAQAALLAVALAPALAEEDDLSSARGLAYALSIILWPLATMLMGLGMLRRLGGDHEGDDWYA